MSETLRRRLTIAVLSFLLSAGLAFAAGQIDRGDLEDLVAKIVGDAKLTSVEKDSRLGELVEKYVPLETGRTRDVAKHGANFEVSVCGMRDGVVVRRFEFPDEEVGLWKKWDRLSWTDTLKKENSSLSYWPQVKVPADLHRVPNPGYEPEKVDPEQIGTQKQFMAWLRGYTSRWQQRGWKLSEFEKGLAKHWLIPGTITKVNGSCVYFKLLGEVKIDVPRLNGNGEVVERAPYGLNGDEFQWQMEDPQFLELMHPGTAIKILAHLNKDSWRDDGQFTACLWIWDVAK